MCVSMLPDIFFGATDTCRYIPWIKALRVSSQRDITMLELSRVGSSSLYAAVRGPLRRHDIS